MLVSIGSGWRSVTSLGTDEARTPSPMAGLPTLTPFLEAAQNKLSTSRKTKSDFNEQLGIIAFLKGNIIGIDQAELGACSWI
jgi:hypothetical protein